MFCPKCGSPIPEDAVFCMNCGEKIETAAPEADSAPAEITPAEEAPIPASGKKPKKKEGRSPRFRARTSACRRGSCQQQPVAKQHCRKSGKAYRRQLERSISGKWRRYHPRKNLGGFTCTVEKGGAATISFSERSISDLSFYLTYSPERTKAVNDGEKLADYCYDVKASDDPDASAFGYAFVSDDTFSVVILSDPELSFAFTASDKS